jgi:hypothetical protein
MASSLQEFLLPQSVLRVISRIKAGRGPLASWLGFHANRYEEDTVSISGPNTLRAPSSIRNHSYRIFDHTRVPMKFRPPGTGPGVVAANPMGNQQISICRFHQKIALNYEFLGNLSPMIGPNSNIDEGGKNYIAQQTTFLAEQGNNAIELMAAGMMRNSLYMISSGDNWLPSFAAPTGTQYGFQVDFKIPASNMNQLNMLGTGNIITAPWNNADAPILDNIQQIIAAYAQLSRYRLTDIWINSTLWMSIITNTQVRNTAGSSNTPFAEYESTMEKGMEDTGPANNYSAILRGQPTIKWHFCDDTLAFNTDIDPSYLLQPAGAVPSTAALNKLIPDNMAIFCTEPNRNWTQLVYGGEWVVERPGMPASLRAGWHFWHEYHTQPSAIELICLLNAVPILYIPLVLAPAQVVY